jgi:hypothetical protein
MPACGRRPLSLGLVVAVRRSPSIGSATGPNVTRTTYAGSRATVGLACGLNVTRSGAASIGVTLGPDASENRVL